MQMPKIKHGYVLCPVCIGKGTLVGHTRCYFCLGDETVPKEKREEWWRLEYENNE